MRGKPSHDSPRTALRSLELIAFLSVQKTADALGRDLVGVLRPADLSPTQYNVLRILRGAGGGVACQEIASRMITRDPDMTRLLDRLEKRHLVRRERQTADRRVVLTTITQAGLDALASLDAPIREAHQKQLAHMGRQKLEQLIELLDLARSPLSAKKPPTARVGPAR